MPSLLLELFSEEIPARMQAEAASHLGLALDKLLGAKAKTFVTPRRLAAIIDDLPKQQPDISQELKGPKVGAPDAALQGFLKKTGLRQDQLIVRDGVYFADITQKGRPTAEVLRELIEKILSEFPWPKSMRWGSGEASWVRPLHSILCLFDGKIVPVEFAGVNAGNFTYGHRFLAPEQIIISAAQDYETALEGAKIIADRNRRKAEILKQLEENCQKLGISLHADNSLLEEVTGLVEWPVVLAGKIDAGYMDLPEEVLILEMKNHQKYFATRDNSGKLSPYFLITSNMHSKDQGKAIIAGNERVLRARFADGRFFWDMDRKTKLEDFAAKLKDVTYHAKLGSMADKVARVLALAKALAEKMRYSAVIFPEIERAASLCKADLVCGMVGEFPELQGVMGRYYALHHGEKPQVAEAIRDHYKPQGPMDTVPAAPISICVALADKLDTLIAMFAIGEKPTGSKDPFALRRAALGVIRIVLENGLRLNLSAFFKNPPLRSIALNEAREKLVQKTEEKLHSPDRVGKYLTLNETACSDIGEDAANKIASELLAFFHERLAVQLKEQGIRHDVIKAVISGFDDDLLLIVARARALQDFLFSDDGNNLLAAYKRAANILAIEEKKDKTSYLAAELQQSVLQEEAEKKMAARLAEAAAQIAVLQKSEDFNGVMKLLAALREPLNQFFEKIMVNCEDKNLRANRLRLLSGIRKTMNEIANFDLMEG